MKIVILKDMDDDSVLRILSCADDVDTDALAKDILEKEYEIDGEIRDIDEVCSELQSKYSFETVKNFKKLGGNSRPLVAEMKANLYSVSNTLYV